MSCNVSNEGGLVPSFIGSGEDDSVKVYNDDNGNGYNLLGWTERSS